MSSKVELLPFTIFHQQTAAIVHVDPITVGAANGIGGGLASVLSPAKIANAAAVVDTPDIEGQVIKQTAPIAILLVWIVAVMTLFFTTSDVTTLIIGSIIALGALLFVSAIFYYYVKKSNT